jgi:hypothetical protein
MNAIIHMKHAMIEREMIRAEQEREAERKAITLRGKLMHERNEILAAIAPFFDVEKWDEWVEAGPDKLVDFVKYAKKEWVQIAVEFDTQLSAADMLELAGWKL